MSAQVRRRLARFFNSGNGKHGFQAQFRLRRAFGSVTGISQTKHLRSGSPFARKTATHVFTFAPDFVVFTDSANLFYKCDELVMR